ncbi:MAG TPA: BON domain-containing protein [Ktedonobacterales bacterium]
MRYEEFPVVGGVTARRVLRFRQRLRGADVPSVPARFRGGPDGPNGRLKRLWLLPADGAVWLQIERRTRPWRTQAVTMPLSADQSEAPTHHALELHAGMRTVCHEGVVGRLEGITFDAEAGRALYLLVRIRGDVDALVTSDADPYRDLLPLSGQLAQISPAWAAASRGHNGNGNGAVLHLDATVEQVAAADVVRADGVLAADIATILNQNPAAEPLLSRLGIEVHDGTVTLTGTVPTARHRASIEQDVWHIPGVFTVRNELRVSER